MSDGRIDIPDTNEARLTFAASTGLSFFALVYAPAHLKEGGI